METSEACLKRPQVGDVSRSPRAARRPSGASRCGCGQGPWRAVGSLRMFPCGHAAGWRAAPGDTATLAHRGPRGAWYDGR